MDVERVVQYLEDGAATLALVRLCRLACEEESGVMRLGRWEQAPAMEPEFVKKRLDNERWPDIRELESHPLDWLRGLDEYVHCHTRFHRTVSLTDGDARFHLIRHVHPHSYPSYRDRQRGNLQYHLRHHRFVPCALHGHPVALQAVSDVCEQAAAAILQRQRLVVAVARFDDGVTEEINWNHGNGHFHMTGLSDAPTRRRSIEAALDFARQHHADLLVFPELTIPADLRDDIRDDLQARASSVGKESDASALPALIALGSFHEQDATHQHLNRALLVDRFGDVLLTADKRAKVTIAHQGRDWGEALQVAPTPCSLLPLDIGLLALAICKDVFDGPVSRQLQDVGLDWLLAPSMTDHLGPHRTNTGNLLRAHGTVSIVANQPMPGCTRSGDAFPCGYVDRPDGPTECANLLTLVEIPLSIRLDQA